MTAMATLLIFGVLAMGLSSCHADQTVNDYIYWKKADISAWHTYFPSRALEQEQLINQLAVVAVNKVNSGLNSSLASIVAFQAQELTTAQMLMAGTDAEGCIRGISDYLSKGIAEEISTYDDCSADALSKLKRLNTTLSKVEVAYLAALKRALQGIDACARTYPNKDSIDRLRSCVESMNIAYFTAAQVVNSSMTPSPAMTYFIDAVVGCASNAANNVAAKGKKFLQMLVECAQVSGTVDIPSYQDEVNQWKGYIDTLAFQVYQAQAQSRPQVQQVESQMKYFYNLQKAAMEKYVIEPRDLAYYFNQLYVHLGDYYNTMVATFMDNPGDAACQPTGLQMLNNAVNEGATKFLQCDLQIVNTTKQLFARVNTNFGYLNGLLPSIGNAAILSCFAEGYIFAPHTISSCAALTQTRFLGEYTERYTNITQDVNTLTSYEGHFSSSNTSLPCGDSSLWRVLYAADVALYTAQRCIYTTSGTTYDVTTPFTGTTYDVTTPGTVTTSSPA